MENPKEGYSTYIIGIVESNILKYGHYKAYYKIFMFSTIYNLLRT